VKAVLQAAGIITKGGQAGELTERIKTETAVVKEQFERIGLRPE
jgi:hypothetical protein